MKPHPTVVSFALCLALIAVLLPACGEGDSNSAPVPANNDPMPDADPMPDVEPEPMPDVQPDPEPENVPVLTMCGGFVPRGDTSTFEACASCMDEKCCDVSTACGEDPDCLALAQCQAACELGDSDCEETCFFEAPNMAKFLFTPVTRCRDEGCLPSCSPAVDYSCLGEPPPEPNAEASELDVAIAVFDPRSGPVNGASVKLCVSDDVLCENPIITGFTAGRGAIEGTLLRGPGGFEEGFFGYVEVTGANRFPTRHFVRLTLEENPVRIGTFIIGQTAANSAMAALGVEQDPNRASAIVRALDCSFERARGALIDVSSADDQTASVFLVDGMPNPDATETSLDGEAFFFNLPVGDATVTGTSKADGVLFFEGEFSFRAGFATSVFPLPNQ